MARSMRHTPDVPKVWVPKKRDVIDWHALSQVDDLTDVPDLFPEED